MSHDIDPALIAQMASFGGRPLTEADGVKSSGGPTWYFGWDGNGLATPEQERANRAIADAMPRFEITGRNRSTANMVGLWEGSLKVNNGRHFNTFRQVSGSCVGNGGGQATRYVAACDQAIRGEAEEGLELMFWLLAYGKSREIMGARGRGEGSLGGAMAEAVKLVGFPSQKVSGLPVPDESDGLSWGKSVEIAWSYYPSQPRGDWDAEGKKHPIQTTAKMRSSDDVREAIRNYYACTCASMWGGQMRPSVTEGVLLNTHSDSWSHQMSIIGWQDHPSLGELFYILNSWGPQTHGTCPTGAPPGGFWVRKKDVDFMCADEVYAFSQWQGFPAQEINWYI